ncbi:MAG: hypothetical protein AAFW70_11985 [Cyanobacteria bacterium J06635_10]
MEYTSEVGFYFTIKSPKLQQSISTNDLVQLGIYFSQTAFPTKVSKDNPLLWVEIQKKEQELATFESVGLDADSCLLCDFLTRNNSTKQFDLTELLDAIAILSTLSKEPGISSFGREELYELIAPYKWDCFSSTEDCTLQELLDHQNNFLWNLILNVYERKSNRLQGIETLEKMLQRNF